MSLKTAPHSRPHGSRVAARFWLAGWLAAVAIAACTDPRTVVIARSAGEAGPDAGAGAGGGPAAAGASGDRAEAGGPPPISSPRGRVKVVNGNLVTDTNTPLRGLTLPVDTGWTLTDYDYDLIASIAQTSGLNTLHVYLENSTQVTTVNESEGDALVSLAEHAGMYVILGVGTGANLNAFDATKLMNFWANYGARYANNTHVLFEIQNNPELTACGQSVATKTLDMEHTMYKLIRSVAPDSHVLLLSTTAFLQPAALKNAITNLSSDVDWSNASIDMDITNIKLPCQPLANLSDLTDIAQPRGVALLIGQLPDSAWGPYITAFEQAKIGWMQFAYFADTATRDLAGYLSATKAAGVTWCPDQGTFPEDSSTCTH